MKSEKAIIDAVIKGDINQYSLLVKKHSGKVFALAKSLLKNKEDAEEVVQTVFLKAFRSLKSFRGEAKFSSFLYRICYNECMNELQARKTMVNMDREVATGGEDIGDGFYLIKKEEQKRFLSMALKRINPEDSMILTLFYLEGQSCLEIVELTGMTLVNVKVKLHRARKSLAKSLNTLLNKEAQNLY